MDYHLPLWFVKSGSFISTSPIHLGRLKFLQWYSAALACNIQLVLPWQLYPRLTVPSPYPNGNTARGKLFNVFVRGIYEDLTWAHFRYSPFQVQPFSTQVFP